MRKKVLPFLLVLVPAFAFADIENAFTFDKAEDYKRIVMDITFDESAWVTVLGSDVDTQTTISLRREGSDTVSYEESHSGSFSTTIDKFVVPGYWRVWAYVTTTSGTEVLQVDRTSRVRVRAYDWHNSPLDAEAAYIIEGVKNTPVDVVNEYLLGQGWTTENTKARNNEQAFLALSAYWLSHDVTDNPLKGHGYPIPLLTPDFAKLLMAAGANINVDAANINSGSREEAWVRKILESIRYPTIEASNFSFVRTENEAKSIVFGAFYTAEKVLQFQKSEIEDELAAIVAIIAGQPTLNPQDIALLDNIELLE